MKSNVPWSVKGIDRDARETAKEAARREGMTVGEWLNQTIYSAGDPNAAPTVGEIEGLKPRDLAAAIEHLSRRISASEAKSAEAVETLARSLGGAVERLQRFERGAPTEGGADPALAARIAVLEEKTSGNQRIDALRALERAVGQVAVQFNTAHQSTLSRLETTERQLQSIASRIEESAPSVSAEAVRDALEGMASRIARAEKIAAEAAQLKSEASESADADFVHKTGVRLRILGDEIKRGGDQIRTLEATIAKLSQQIDAAERRSAEGVQKVAETIVDLRTQFAAAEQAPARAEIEAAFSEIAQRTEERIETLQRSFEAIARKLDAGAPAQTIPVPESKPPPEHAAVAIADPEPLDDLDNELEDAFAALELDDPIPTPSAARAAPTDDFAFAPEEPEPEEAEAQLDTETEDVLAEIREAFGFDEPREPEPEPQDLAADVEEEAAEAEVAATPAVAAEPPPVAVTAPPKEVDTAQADYLKAARQAAREAAAKAAAEEASGKKKLTPKQRAILAARLKRRREEESKAKAAEPLVAEPPPQPADEAGAAPKTSVKERVMALVGKIKARSALREEGPTLDSAEGESQPSAAPNLTASVAGALQKVKSIPNAGGVLGLAAAIVLLLGASVLVFKDFGKPKAERRVETAPATAAAAPAISGERIEPAPPAADETIRPRDLYLDNIVALKSATNDAEAQVALKRIEEAAALGHPPAQLQIGELYKLGQLYDRDLSAARQWFERAANGGNVLAMHRLGVMAARGEGGPVDSDASISWFEKAASFGLVDSQYNLGATYHPTADGSQNGIQDRAKAYFWYSIAAKNGDAQAAAMAAGLAASMPADERSAKDAEVAAWAAKTPDPLANELAPAT